MARTARRACRTADPRQPCSPGWLAVSGVVVTRGREGRGGRHLAGRASKSLDADAGAAVRPAERRPRSRRIREARREIRAEGDDSVGSGWRRRLRYRVELEPACGAGIRSADGSCSEGRVTGSPRTPWPTRTRVRTASLKLAGQDAVSLARRRLPRRLRDPRPHPARRSSLTWATGGEVYRRR